MDKISLLRLFNARIFLGSYRKNWNPEISGLLQCQRDNILILNLQQSTFRLKKFLLMLELVGRKRGRAFFIMNEDGNGLSSLLKSTKQHFVCHYKPGVLSNYGLVGRYYLRSDFYNSLVFKKFPCALVTIPDSKALNEARHIRIPGAYLADSSSNAYFAPYGIPGNPEYQAFQLLVNLSVRALIAGDRRGRLTFGRTISAFVRNFLIKKVHKTDKFYGLTRIGYLRTDIRKFVVPRIVKKFPLLIRKPVIKNYYNAIHFLNKKMTSNMLSSFTRLIKTKQLFFDFLRKITAVHLFNTSITDFNYFPKILFNSNFNLYLALWIRNRNFKKRRLIKKNYKNNRWYICRNHIIKNKLKWTMLIKRLKIQKMNAFFEEIKNKKKKTTIQRLKLLKRKLRKGKRIKKTKRKIKQKQKKFKKPKLIFSEKTFTNIRRIIIPKQINELNNMSFKKRIKCKISFYNWWKKKIRLSTKKIKRRVRKLLRIQNRSNYSFQKVQRLAKNLMNKQKPYKTHNIPLVSIDQNSFRSPHMRKWQLALVHFSSFSKFDYLFPTEKGGSSFNKFKRKRRLKDVYRIINRTMRKVSDKDQAVLRLRAKWRHLVFKVKELRLKRRFKRRYKPPHKRRIWRLRKLAVRRLLQKRRMMRKKKKRINV